MSRIGIIQKVLDLLQEESYEVNSIDMDHLNDGSMSMRVNIHKIEGKCDNRACGCEIL